MGTPGCRRAFFAPALSVVAFLFMVAAMTSLAEANTSEQLWQKHIATYDMKFANTAEYNRRRRIFMSSLIRIRIHNRRNDRGLSTYRMTINRFSHLTHAEFAASYLGLVVPREPPTYVNVDTGLLRAKRKIIPGTIDLRNTLCVTPVRYQGRCSSSYAFTAVDLVEYNYCRQNGGQISLSVQQMVDCSRPFGNSACSGGTCENTWRYLRKFRGVDTQRQYPYKAKAQTCRAKRTVRISRLRVVKIAKSERKMMEYLAESGPISVTFRASVDFMFYGSGVFDDDDCDGTVNHAMTLIGYGHDKKNGNFWLLKNSHGTAYGEAGFIRVKRGVNLCRIRGKPMGLKVQFRKKTRKDASGKGYDCARNTPCTRTNRALFRFYFPSRLRQSSFVQCAMTGESCWVMNCAPGTVWNQASTSCDWS